MRNFCLSFIATFLIVLPMVAQTRQLSPLVGKAKRTLPPTTVVQVQKKAIGIESEVVDSHGIIVSPAAGAHHFYARSGIAYYLDFEDIMVGEQDDAVEIVDCGDGTVYIKDIISHYLSGAWVKGTKNGNTITVAPRQPIAYSAEYHSTISVRWGRIDLEGAFQADDGYADAFTFTIDGDVISLQGTTQDAEGEEGHFMGLFWDDDNTALGYGDVESVWTLLNTVSKVDELPYLNTFETLDEQNSFSIIDNNNDGITWHFIMNSDYEHYARYSYSDTEDADDWLVSPSILLQAGKHYRMAFDTRIADSEELIEVAMGNQPTAEAMTRQVIDPTEVIWTENKTLENGDIVVDETGYYYFGIHAISEKDKYRLYADNFLVDVIEMEAPAAVTDLQVIPTKNMLEATVTFTAPSTKRDGTPLEGNMTKIDLLRDGQVIKTFENVAPGTSLSHVDNADDLAIGYHTYQVVAFNEKGKGKMSDEVRVYLTAVIEVPYYFDLRDEKNIDVFTIIDNNNDGSTWKWDDGYGTSYVYNADNSGDDYLISPKIHLQGGKNYFMSINAVTSGYPERFEVLLGKEPTVEALTTQVIAPTDVTNFEDPGDIFEQIFSVPEDGIYHLALHAISDADMDHLIINFISIEDGQSPTSPAAPDFEVIPDAEGELLAELKITVPTLACDGTPLGDILEGGIDIYRDDEMVGSLYGAMPVGETLSYFDSPSTNGYHVYRLIPYNESGYGMRSEKDTVYVGVDIPLAVENFIATDNLNHVTLKWDKVGNVGENEHFVNPQKVDYTIWSTKMEEGWFGNELVYDEALATVRDQNTFDIDYDTETGDQKWEFWVVEPSSAAGTGNNTVTGLVVGAPYQLPINEGFTDNALHYFWDSNAELLVSSDANDGDTSALAMLTSEAGEIYFLSGKFDIKDAAYPVLAFDVKAQGISQLNVTGSVDGAEQALIQPGIPISENYTTVCVPLTSLKNGHYAQVGFTAEFTTPSEFDFFGELQTLGDVMLIDNVRIVDDQALAVGQVENNTGHALDIYTLDGRLMRDNAKSTKGLKGAFVVHQKGGKGKTVIVK